MFTRAFYELHTQLDLPNFFRYSESETIRTLRLQCRGTDSERLIEGVFGSKRQLYKRVAEYSHYQTNDLYTALARRPYRDLLRCADSLINVLNSKPEFSQQKIARTDLIIDAPPAHREVEFKVPVYFPKEDIYRPLADVSPIIDALARTQFDDYVKRVRIFAPRDLLDRLASIDFEAAVRERLVH